jgi:predicted DNA-binding protein
MPTRKKRLNITLPKHIAVYLKMIAMRDDVPQATKAAELLEKALEIEEDAFFSRLADERVRKNKKFISHKEFWSKVL